METTPQNPAASKKAVFTEHRAFAAPFDGGTHFDPAAHPGDILAYLVRADDRYDTPVDLLFGAVQAAAEDLAIAEFAAQRETEAIEEMPRVLGRIRDRLLAALWMAERMGEDAEVSS